MDSFGKKICRVSISKLSLHKNQRLGVTNKKTAVKSKKALTSTKLRAKLLKIMQI
jgi:hypothetical protein